MCMVIESSTIQDQYDPDHLLNCETDSFYDTEMTSSILYSKKRAAGTWILKVQEVYKLPQSTMEQVLPNCFRQPPRQQVIQNPCLCAWTSRTCLSKYIRLGTINEHSGQTLTFLGCMSYL